MPEGPELRILEAGLACIARYGMGKTSIDDVARVAGLSRATVYRHFSGGRDQLIRAVVVWEVERFFGSLAEAVVGLEDLEEALVEALMFAHVAIERHEVFQKVLHTEPELLLPQLTTESNRVLTWISIFLLPYTARLWGGNHESQDVARAADYVARMILSFIGAPGSWDLTDRDQTVKLVRTELLAGLRAVS
ncbi:MAG: TetR/AcrR family transcriptional regulator [Acidimicrobiales bacterium]